MTEIALQGYGAGDSMAMTQSFQVSFSLDLVTWQLYKEENVVKVNYYMASKMSRANNKIQHADWPKIGPITSNTSPASYWTDFLLTQARIDTLINDCLFFFTDLN